MPPIKQHRAELEVERAALEMGERAREGRGDDLVGAGGDRDRRRDVVEDQQRRDQEAAADAEHARQEPDRRPHGEQDEEIDRHLGDREIDAHPSNPIVKLAREEPSRSVAQVLGQVGCSCADIAAKSNDAGPINAGNSKEFRNMLKCGNGSHQAAWRAGLRSFLLEQLAHQLLVDLAGRVHAVVLLEGGDGLLGLLRPSRRRPNRRRSRSC